jgi:hypothetical protein
MNNTDEGVNTRDFKFRYLLFLLLLGSSYGDIVIWNNIVDGQPWIK